LKTGKLQTLATAVWTHTLLMKLRGAADADKTDECSCFP